MFLYCCVAICQHFRLLNKRICVCKFICCNQKYNPVPVTGDSAAMPNTVRATLVHGYQISSP